MTTSLQCVSPAQIQHALNKIWESLETKNVTRACLFNMIFYTQKNHRSIYMQQIAQKVVEKFPSRIIFISVDTTSAENSLKTEVSILSSSKGEFDVACDYIQIETCGSFKERIPFVLLPNLLPDLPTYLLWAENPDVNSPLYVQLEQLASRLIFDSESTDNISHFAKAVLDTNQQLHCDIADLNWARIEDWREMFSMTFYSQENLKQIQCAKTITITYNCTASTFFCHTQIQAIYLQAWLACQMGWQLQSSTHSIFHYLGPNGPIEIVLEAKSETDLPPGLILSVTLTSSQDHQFCFVRSKQQLHQITLVHSTLEQCSLPCHYIFPKAESGHSLVKEICHRGTSQHFLKVLDLVKRMPTN